MRRLYLQVYLAFLGILVVFAVLSGALWFFLHDDDDGRRAFEGVAEILSPLMKEHGKLVVSVVLSCACDFR